MEEKDEKSDESASKRQKQETKQQRIAELLQQIKAKKAAETPLLHWCYAMKLLQLDPNHANGHFHRGFCLGQFGQAAGVRGGLHAQY